MLAGVVWAWLSTASAIAQARWRHDRPAAAACLVCSMTSRNTILALSWEIRPNATASRYIRCARRANPPFAPRTLLPAALLALRRTACKHPSADIAIDQLT